MTSSPFFNLHRTAFIQNWGRFFLLGIALVILGAIAIYASTMTTLISVVFLGTLLFIGGIMLILDAFMFWWKKWRGFFPLILSGLLYAILGFMFINQPIIASASLTLFLGVFYLVIGIFRLAQAAFAPVPNWGWVFFSGLVSLLLGALILSNWPQSALFIIGLFVGIDLVFVGWAYIMMALAARSLNK